MLILESNHDEILLRESPYPWSVKARIGGSHGHSPLDPIDVSQRRTARLPAQTSLF